jgi:hypothetical protein
MWLLFEILYQLNRHQIETSTSVLVVDTYNLAFFLGLMIWAWMRKKNGLIIATSILALVNVIVYIAAFNWVGIIIRNDFLEGTTSFSPFLWHYAEIALILCIMGLILHRYLQTRTLRSKSGSAFLTFAVIVGVFILSNELVNLWVLIPYQSGEMISDYTRQANKFGLPILWGLCSFALLFIGLRKFRLLRIISLTLFFITLLKLAIFDLRGISEAGRIAAFISLGVILLVMSFMYQKVKKLIFTEHQEEKEEKTMKEDQPPIGG